MYTVVLMAALATSNAAPAWGHHGDYNYPCYGCFGGYGCYAGGYSHGCYGFWTGSSGYGYWGGSPYASHLCGGCYGCYGGYACYGLPFPGGAPVPYPGGTTYFGPGMTNPIPPPGLTPAPGTPAPEVTPAPKADKNEQTRAKVRIEIPADAKLYVDGVLMKTGSALRMFRTPELTPDQTYSYELKAVLVRDGQTFTDSQQIHVRPGSVASASFATLEQKAVAAAKSTQSTAQR
jgi:uncharacterized protein (TIGR03000 family)